MDIKKLREELIQNPRQGDELFKGCFKVRIAIKSKGKSGGGLLITFVKIEGKKICLLTIYDKSDQESVSISYLRSILSDLKLL